jgi:Tol biopolymer transport system component
MAISVLLSVLFTFSSFAYADTLDTFKIAFYSDRDGFQGIFTMNDDGTGVKMLASGRNPEFSPDGSKIAYMYFSGSTYDIYTMNADGSGIKNITGTSNTYEGYPSFYLLHNKIGQYCKRNSPILQS